MFCNRQAEKVSFAGPPTNGLGGAVLTTIRATRAQVLGFSGEFINFAETLDLHRSGIGGGDISGHHYGVTADI